MDPKKTAEAASAKDCTVPGPVSSPAVSDSGHAVSSAVTLLVRQLNALKKLLRRHGSTREQAEDLVQEAVLRLHVYTREGGRVDNPDAFLRRTALNLAVDAYRHARADRYADDPVEALDLIDVGPTPDEVCAAEQRLNNMKKALDRANPRTRDVFFMHRLQGLSHAEIAERLGVSVSAIEKHVASAVTLLAIERQRE
jgi:RNA polymerase sigma factor (sigma-70 family)